MKKCPYCGKEYPDDATVCIIDTTELVEHPPKPKPVKEKPSPEPYRPWPDYQWRAKDAWKCIGIILCFALILFAANHFLNLISPRFYLSGPGFAFRYLLHYSVELLAVIYFARTETFETFLQSVGLNRKPTDYAWFGVTMALIIRFAGHFMLAHGWGKGVYNYDLHKFQTTLGLERYFFLVPLVLLAPLFEETMYRGFLYKAFRGSYSIVVSMFLIVAWICNTHWPQYSHSWIAAMDLSALTIVQCYLREKSLSLWDCIICHFVFNAVILLF